MHYTTVTVLIQTPDKERPVLIIAAIFETKAKEIEAQGGRGNILDTV